MLNNQEAKFIKSLQIKKYRYKHSAFMVEGAKNILELLKSDFIIRKLILTNEFHEDIQHQLINVDFEIYLESQKKIESLGSYKSNNAGIAVVEIPEMQEPAIGNEFVLALDDINDPGNLGTIIRTADWYGISKIIASPNTADVYNPKVIQASMGSFTRVKVYSMDLSEFLSQHRAFYKIGADLQGKSVHDIQVRKPMIIVMGSESQGLSPEITADLDEIVTIPRYGNAESLNVAMSTAIICDNISRQLKG